MNINNVSSPHSPTVGVTSPESTPIPQREEVTPPPQAEIITGGPSPKPAGHQEQPETPVAHQESPKEQPETPVAHQESPKEQHAATPHAEGAKEAKSDDAGQPVPQAKQAAEPKPFDIASVLGLIKDTYSFQESDEDWKLLPDLKLQPDNAFMAGFFEHKLVNLCRQGYSELVNSPDEGDPKLIKLEAERKQLGAPKLSFSGVLTDELRRKVNTGSLARLLYHAGRFAHFLLYFAGLPFVPFLNLAFWCDYRYQKHTFDAPVAAKNESKDGTQSKGKWFTMEATALYGLKQQLSNEKFKYDTAVRQTVAAQMEAVRKNGELALDLASEIDAIEKKASEYVFHSKINEETSAKLEEQLNNLENRYAKQRGVFNLTTAVLFPINKKYKTSTSGKNEDADYDNKDDYAFANMMATYEHAINYGNNCAIFDRISANYKPELGEDQEQKIKHWFKL